MQGGLRGADGWLALTLLLDDGREKSDYRTSPSSNRHRRPRLQAPHARRRPIASLLVQASKCLGASHPFAGTKKRRPNAAFFGALVGADAAMQRALADDQIACFKKTMNSQEFMEEERKAIIGRGTPNNEGDRALAATQVGCEGRLSGRPFVAGGDCRSALF